MSFNQSRGDKNEPSHYRKVGRPSFQRNYSGGSGRGGGVGITTAPPSSSSFSSNTRKVNNHAQGLQPRVNIPNTITNSNPDFINSAAPGLPNGAHLQQSAQGASGAPVTGGAAMPSDVSAQKTTPGLPRVLNGGAGVSNSDATGPSTPTKEPANASPAFPPLQFGSISPGIMNGMKIPARTSSAPPNFDEQKQAQALLDSLKAVKVPTPAVPKQYLQSKNDVGAVDQSSSIEVHSIPKPKKDVQTLPTPLAIQSQKLSVPLITMQSQMPFHHPQLNVQYGGLNPQMPSQGISNMPLPMALPMGSPPQVQQPVFLTGIPHQMQPPIHQGQTLNFSPQMGPPQMPPQLGNMGIGLGQHYPQQQQTGKLGVPHRKTVKITHPETLEELRLDSGSEGPAPRLAHLHPHPHPHGLAQSQAVPSFPAGHPMNYISYNASSLFVQPPTSNPLTSTQSAPGAPMLCNQVMVKPAAKALEKVNESSLLGSAPAIGKNELPKTPRTHGNSSSTLSPMASKPSNATSGSFRSENITNSAPPATIENSVQHVKSVAEVAKGTAASKSVSFKEKVQPTPEQAEGLSEVLKTSNLSIGTKEVLEISKQGSSGEEGLKGIEAMVIETISDNSTRIQEPNAEQVSEERKKDVMSSEREQHEATTTTSDQETRDDMGNSASLTFHTSSVDANKAKGNIGKSKKKRKDILKFADAQGTSSDLYNAYKGPEEKKETATSSETLEISSGITTKQVEKYVPHGHNKFEPDDWEDAADISTPKLETSVIGNLIGNDGMLKKYSRDFLLKFSEQCKEPPLGFELTLDIAEAVISYGNASRESFPSPGRVVDRSAVRLDRRLSNIGHDDRWSKQPGPMGGPGRDMRIDIGYAGNVASFRPVHGGVLRNPRIQTSGQFTSGILSGPMQSPGPHMQRNNSDSDRWQRVSGNQKGLMPSPHTTMAVMHKAERKYEVGKVTDEEQAKQRQLKGILNKLTPQNFEKLFDQVKQVNIDNAETLSGVINQIFDKALMEPTFCEMYANFCSRLAVELPDFSQHNEKITFKRLLLNKCQEEFERGEREEQEANRTDEEGEVKQTEEQREEKRIKARRRMLGNIRLIGELYKKKMLTERIMHECIKKLLGQLQKPDEEDLESLCKLMSTIGAMIDHSKAKEHLDVYFDTMSKLSNSMMLSSRVRFMLKDVIDLRKNRWQQRRKVEGPKKIEEVHRDAAQERNAQTTRLARGPSFNSSSLRRGQGSNSNLLPSPNSQMGGFRGPQQLHGYVNQDFRFENRTLSMPLRPIGDNDSITLGPQGGLARGMSIRGQPPPMPSPADSRRVGPGPNGYGLREDLGSNQDTRNLQHDSIPYSQNVSSDKILSEESLRDMSMEAIKEFYSARDEKEVVQCIKDLNAPSFYPKMISIWVIDSFERRDVDRDLLAKLLVNLSKSQHGMLSQDSYIQGFEAVLAILEDSVNDAPKAAEYLGGIFGKMLLENVIPYKKVCQLIHEGGEEQGRLVEIGLAAEVLGVVLEIIKSEKGEIFFNDIRAGSDIRVEDFRPPNSKKPLRLDKFI